VDTINLVGWKVHRGALLPLRIMDLPSISRNVPLQTGSHYLQMQMMERMRVWYMRRCLILGKFDVKFEIREAYLKKVLKRIL
jgi:hypothetical protein